MAQATWVALAVLGATLAGCADDGGAPAEGGAAQAPLLAVLEVDSPRNLFGDGTQVVLRVRLSSGEQAVQAGIALPPGVEAVSGDVRFDGTLRAGEPLELRAFLRAQPGEHVLRGWAELPARAIAGGRAAPSDLLGVRGDADAAEVFEPEFEPEPVQLSYILAFHADPDDSRRLSASVSSQVAMPARILLTLPPPPNGIELVQGQAEWSGSLQAGEPRPLTYVVAFTGADGTYEARLHLYPDAAVDGRVIEDLIRFEVEDGKARVTHDQ